MTAPEITDEQLRELFARHCQCRPLDFTRREDDHAAIHDCDTGILRDVQVALAVVRFDDIGRIQAMREARARCAEHLALVPNGHGGYTRLSKAVTVGRVWKLWASRYESGKLWHVGDRRWVEIHQLPHPIVPVLVEEILGDPYDAEVTHYGWQYAEGSRYRHGDVPTMIQVRTGSDPKNPRRARMFLDMCFPYGLDAEIERGEGSVVPLRITERDDGSALEESQSP